ncbi:MAG: tetraacyldisaccharide 4'-kinase [Planctomycetia bacterium]|nr:tetraacyldisaccharide 4'-kinase [Planctomycetia bacterium]
MNLLNDYHRLVSGSSHGLFATGARTGLSLLSGGYRVAIGTRNFLYDSGLKSTYKPPRPTISIGNITLGGTGKTPLVAWLAGQLLTLGHHPGFISRGYKSGKRSHGSSACDEAVCEDGPLNDEGHELALKFGDVPHVQHKKRRRAITELLSRHPATDVLLLDDAFQHRQVSRSLDIVLIDASCPFGYMRIFPRGLLREPVSSLRRADFIIVTHADLVTAEELATLLNDLYKVTPTTPVALACHVPLAIYTRDAGRVPFHLWYKENRHSRLMAFSGIGNPAGFRATLKSSGLAVAGAHVFPDHFDYAKANVASMLDWKADQTDADFLVTTMKDWVKLDAVKTRTPLIALEVGIKFLLGEEELLQAVTAIF